MTAKQQAEIGLIGLGVMGANLAFNIAEKGFRIAVYNRPEDRPADFMERAGALARNIVFCETLEEFVAAIRPPRPVILMVTAGAAVDAQAAALKPLLAQNDIVIDCGNSNYHDTVRRFRELEKDGLVFVGAGVSGGEEGARHGPSIMVGGTPASYARVAPVMSAIAARYEGEPCCAYMGGEGAGHFVKMVHNGIEYADMQMIAEIYGVLRDGLGYDAARIASVFDGWSKGPLDSYLIDVTVAVLRAADPKTARPMVDIILDRAGQKGTGKWTTIAAQTLGVAATTIEEAVAARVTSSLKEERIAAEKAYGLSGGLTVADEKAFLAVLEQALFSGKICAYAQGFALMAQAAKDYGWALPMADIARIWRAGCIIRSQFLDTIASAFETGPVASLLVAPSFVARMKQAVPALREVVAKAALAGLPVPALSAALSYFESYRRGNGTANLIQAQRDFFGAHGFERVDEAGGGKHGPWGLKA